MFKLKSPFAIYSLAGIILSIYILLAINQRHDWGGVLLMLFFFTLAYGFRKHEFLKTINFTIIIFAVVSMALYYPQYFLEWGGYSLSGLIIPLIQIIMFGMGTSMSLRDFAAVIKTPKGVIIGVCSQFIIMPILGFTLASTSHFEPEIAAGIVLIGCSPSGLASNVMAYLAKANLALSITITSITTLLAPLVTPILMRALAGALVEIDVYKMMWDISKMIIIPIAAGLIFNKLLRGKSKWVDDAMPYVSMGSIAIILVIITAAGQANLVKIGPALIGIVLIHNLFGYSLGYWSGRFFKLPESDCRTIAIEVGMQNGGLASGIAKEMGKIATLGLAAAVFGPVMNITGSILASWWHSRLPVTEELEVAK